MNNTVKTTLLLAALSGLMLFVGHTFGGNSGMLVGLAFAAVSNLSAWYFSDRVVLASSGAVPIEAPELAWVQQDVAALAAAANMPTPRVYIVPNELSPNAFATGRDPEHGVVAVTAGLLRTLDRREVRGVLAHELAHIANRDTLISSVAATMAAALSMMAHMARWLPIGRSDDDEGGSPLAGLIIMLLAPFIAMIIQMSISRTREYAADATAARLTGDPLGLASALERIHGIGQGVPMHSGSEATHYIANNFASGLGRWFSTHPPMEERVARLRAMR